MYKNTDVLVVGGGVSGTMAAIAAARLGVKVSLIERGGCLGGMWTAGLVGMTLDSGYKDGLLSEFLGLVHREKQCGAATIFEIQKYILEELWYITLPSMKPQLLFGAVMSITSSFGVGPIIDGIFGNPSTDYALYTMVHELQDYANTRLELGYASAIATVLFAIMLIANSAVQKMISKVGE